MQQSSLSIVNLLSKTSFSLVCPFLSCDQCVWHLCVIPSSLVVLLLSHGRLVHTPLALVASFRRHSQLSRVHANKSSVRIYLPAIVTVWPPKLYKSVANVLRGLSGLYHNRVNISKSTLDSFVFFFKLCCTLFVDNMREISERHTLWFYIPFCSQ